MKLVKKTGGNSAVYTTDDGRVTVMRFQRWINSKMTGKYLNVEYLALVGGLEVARGGTLEQLMTHLDRYMADEAAGTLGRRHSYGFFGDNSSAARVK